MGIKMMITERTKGKVLRAVDVKNGDEFFRTSGIKWSKDDRKFMRQDVMRRTTKLRVHPYGNVDHLISAISFVEPKDMAHEDMEVLKSKVHRKRLAIRLKQGR